MRFISKAAAKVQFFFDSAKCFVHKKNALTRNKQFLGIVCVQLRNKKK